MDHGKEREEEAAIAGLLVQTVEFPIQVVSKAITSYLPAMCLFVSKQ